MGLFSRLSPLGLFFEVLRYVRGVPELVNQYGRQRLKLRQVVLLVFDANKQAAP